MPMFEAVAIIKVSADNEDDAAAKVWSMNDHIKYGIDHQEPEITFLEKIEER